MGSNFFNKCFHALNAGLDIIDPNLFVGGMTA